MSGEKRLISNLKLSNFLSFGPSAEDIELQSLNVLIGPNASGKSNLIEASGFLRATSGDLADFVREGGGVSDWLWKGSDVTTTAEVEATLPYQDENKALRHKISFTQVGQRFELTEEDIESRPGGNSVEDPRLFYRFRDGNPVLKVYENLLFLKEESLKERRLGPKDLLSNQSILSQRKDPDQYPEITSLGERYGEIKIYRGWNFGRNTDARRPQKTDLPEDFLAEDARNLGLILNSFQNQPAIWSRLLNNLQLFHESFKDVTTKVYGGTIQIYMHEKGLQYPIPATRLSDGTLRYLSLLAILCHLEPPPLICIEEPEVGLHPDIMPTLAELLVEASSRTQLIVTTHSAELVDALTPMPEAVIVCEKHNDSTVLQRLDQKALKVWLEKYTLGELWRRGELGGNRW